MSAGRDQVKLTEEEVQGLLEENLKVQVAANGRDGFPHLTTLFYDLQDGRIVFWTYGRSQKILNLERDPRVTALVEDGTDYFELRGVSIEGRAEIVREHDRILEIGKAVSVRMFGVDSFEALGEIGAQTVEKQATKRVGVIIHPDRVASWDHRKMT
ncbi:pyridoxamine 5'-phosphate oxidase family protein [Nocardioides sp. L-11A]|uniref:pyridoxamine 5'-phosphate oxidase family protein n=1 Tax=Nocardioides sp. L-11A TaxID=3043848 RepID=UPI00249BCDB8|nr:pyridoxamine 5'-phosphate oxidase family protein [Nocardioides sp. L-11A]